jgi:Family of unknown function (DUF6502)
VDAQFPLVDFLSEFARYLLDAGVSISEFEVAAQLAFLRAASSEARFGNSKINQSAVAAMTGLTRTQVRLLMRTSARSVLRRGGRTEQLVSGWLTDPAFTTSAGNARVLPLVGRQRSFAALAKKYGGDVTPRTLRAEMQRRGYIEFDGDKVSLSRMAKRTKANSQLSQLAIALARVIKRNQPEKGSLSLKFFTAQASYESPVAAGKILLQRRINQGLKAFATDMESAGSAIAKASRRKRNPIRMSRTTFLLVSQD